MVNMSDPFRIARTRHDRLDGEKVIIVLDQAFLELSGSNKRAHLVTSTSKGEGGSERDLSDARPDICHQCLMALLDSPLNKAGKLLVFIKTADKQLIEVHPQMTVPRTWDEFSSLMITFLVRRKIKANENNTTLLRYIKNKVEECFPAGSQKIGLSTQGKRVDLRSYCKGLPRGCPIVFVVGAVAKADPASGYDFLDEKICISDHSLSAAVCCGKICGEFENLWDVV